jgi:hypothetical protein
MASFTDDMNINNESICKKQSTINCIQNELKQKQQDFDELKKVEKDKTNVYGLSMSDCLKAIENENRFHQRPMGRHIRCIEPRWSYAVENIWHQLCQHLFVQIVMMKKFYWVYFHITHADIVRPYLFENIPKEFIMYREPEMCGA